MILHIPFPLFIVNKPLTATFSCCNRPDFSQYEEHNCSFMPQYIFLKFNFLRVKQEASLHIRNEKRLKIELHLQC